MSRWLNHVHAVRLAAFALGYGLTGALTGGTLNRIMVAELELPVSLVGLFFAAPLFIAPFRAWLGHRSDTHPIRGLRREPYVLVGTGLASLGVVLAILILLGAANSALVLALGVMLAFLLHELGRNMAHNSFQALLADKFDKVQRARAMTLFEVVTIVGLIMGAGGVASSLKVYSVSRLVSVTIGVAVVSFIFTLIAVWRNESRQQDSQAIEAARSSSFGQVLRQIALSDQQVKLFFVLIMLVVLGTLAQDVLLEPYGALVLNMDVASTSRLTMFWGLGVIVAMVASGTFLIKRFGEKAVLRIGLVATIIVFGGVIFTGANGSVALFRPLVAVMGFGTGLAGAGLLTSIINFTTHSRAGVLLGVWGFAMIAGRSLGSLFGGILVDTFSALTQGNYFVAYSVVFALEGLLLVVALALTVRVSASQSLAYRENTRLSYDGISGAAAVS